MSDATSPSPRRRQLRLGLAVLGGVVFALGLLTAVVPSGAAASLGALVALLGNDYLVVAVVASVALVILVVVLVATGREGFDQSTPPAPEGIYPVQRFGEEIDAFVSEGGFAGTSTAATATVNRHEAVRTALREVAVTTVMRDEHCTRAEAEARIASGDWTDEAVAATYLAEGKTPTLGSRLRAAVGGASPAERAAAVTATEIARLDAEAVR